MGAYAQTYSATYLPGNAPKTTEEGQSGTNQCGGGSSQTSNCQNVYVNSIDDFCLFAPPETGTIGETERIEVAWCIKSGYGTRLIPEGAITGAHFVQTPDYVQITGVGDLTKLNIAAGDEGGELDPHGADGNGNPIGGLIFSSAFGQLQQIHEWTNFMAADEFCLRACKDGPNAPALCEHIYDVMGCAWNMPGDYSNDSFDSCEGDTGEPMGVYGHSTFHQGDPSTPAAHPAPSSSNCATLTALGNGATASGVTAASTSSGVSSTSVVSSASASASSTVTASSNSSQSSASSTGSLTSSASRSVASATGTASASGTNSANGSAASDSTSGAVFGVRMSGSVVAIGMAAIGAALMI
ncbi:uncharacterized protein STEHIDRAFT_52679 [Stereum hirsutum FP-91666 SS1]|uniref:uncharacterized protein n=1 Tax=Stereum hirsutum (strain FP-91666) TaxID=721885 RepID=UPI000440BD07|nr:uncharacterized protein STEHIDRAFT_52679 [Stereum hirsutum FP-91666 SS1]EIM89089.1 hypothetical protein STEHIDRAFT_52679 [Stereum hirsutum FP-91666 SS1]